MSDTPEPHRPESAEESRHNRDEAPQELGLTIAESDLTQTIAESSDKADIEARTEDADIEARAQDTVRATADAAHRGAANADEHARDIAGQVREQVVRAVGTAATATPAPVAARGRQLADIVRRHPIPVATAVASGFGLTWWATRRGRA
ncbi:hypothetical protein [Nocardia jejuensis]|uniref:hypothetical protein n=1 Tax=Nocardia jejuensis TaxID=328049 RepID=UPI00082D8F14|nr:hypothetical protein [Nocardia jejuensis]